MKLLGNVTTPAASGSAPEAGVTRVLVVLASATRRGAETEGLALADALRGFNDIAAEPVALMPSAGKLRELPVDVLGTSARSVSTLRALRTRARAADVVIAFGSTTLPACAVALSASRARFVYRSIGDPDHWVRGPMHRARTGVLIRRAVHVVALWEQAKTSLIELYGLAPSDVSVIANARSIEHFTVPSAEQKRHARAALGIDSESPVIVYLGALTAEKRVGIAIDAVARMPGATLIIAGEGPERSTLEELAERDAPGRTHFIGSTDDPRSVLHTADALVLTSSTEGMPGAAIEALLCGVPVVAPDVGALRELIEDGVNGRLTGKGSADATSAALTEAGSRVFPRGDVVRATVLDRFGADMVVAKWRDLLEAVAS